MKRVNSDDVGDTSEYRYRIEESAEVIVLISCANAEHEFILMRYHDGGRSQNSLPLKELNDIMNL